MRKFFRIFIKTASLVVLVLAVFLVNAQSSLFKRSGKVTKSEKSENFFIGVFTPSAAFADAPSSDSSPSDSSPSDSDSGGDCDDDAGDDDGC